jgi:hypothetical protein
MSEFQREKELIQKEHVMEVSHECKCGRTRTALISVFCGWVVDPADAAG